MLTSGNRLGKYRIERALGTASALNHPNMCTIYEVGEEGGRAFIAMEHVDGEPLSALIGAGAVAVEDAVRYGTEAADALAHAHDRGVVHGDLKATNAIIDFGDSETVQRVGRLTS